MGFLDNLTEFLEDKLKEFNGDIDVSEGTAVRDIFIKPFTSVNQPIVDEIESIRANLSLVEGAALEAEDLDRLAANFFVTRRSGGKASGSVRIFFSEPIDLFVSQGTVFTSVTGVRFLSKLDNQITSVGLKLNVLGELFYADLDVEAESPGSAGNVDVNFITEIDETSDKIVQVTNPAAFTGGFDSETNQELLDRILFSITIRNLINKPGGKIIVFENFTRIKDILIVGFNDRQEIVGEQVGVGDGVTTGYQLSEDEDVIPGSLEMTVNVQDELVVTGPVAPGIQQLDFWPIEDPTTLTLRKGPSYTGGTDLTLTTHYTLNATNGEVTLTAAGAAFLAADQLHARYVAHPVDPSIVTTDFFGVVTFTTPPSIGAILTADFTHVLMRRDRMSGSGITLGDDTFGSPTNVHIGGKVDYYLKFAGLESRETRIDDLKNDNFLFPQGLNDPAPSATQQYVTTVIRPMVEVLSVEEVNTLTDLPSGVFLTEGVDYTVDLMPNSKNINFSARQRIKLTIINPIKLGVDVFFRYQTHADIQDVQTFMELDENRIITADMLAFAPLPVYLDLSVKIARLPTSPTTAETRQIIIDFINNLHLGSCISTYDLVAHLSSKNVKFLQIPFTFFAERVNRDFSTFNLSSQDRIEVPGNFQFVARTVTVTEIPLSQCQAI